MATPFLASDVMDAAAALLNDTSKSLFTYTAQLPHLRHANQHLENLMIVNGVSIQRQVSVVMTVNSSTSNIDLSLNVGYPSDMLVPIRAWEKGAENTFTLMDEREWEPETDPRISFGVWIFRNNKIYLPPTTATRSIKIDYWRQLGAIVSQGDNEEIAGSQTYLAAKTAELCARYIGQNNDIANDLITFEVAPAQDLLERMYIKNNQGNRARRRRFKSSSSGMFRF